MQKGNWVPLDKNLKKELPSNRAYTKLEAIFSITCDYDENKKATVAGYAKLWKWSRNKVKNFLDSMDIEIYYAENTIKKQNQKGQIKRQIKDRSRTDKGQIRFVDSKGLEPSKDRSRTDKGQIKDRSKDTTINPSINPNPNPNPKPKPKKKKLFPEDSDEFRVAKFLLAHIRKNKPDFKKPNLQTWSRVADLMFRVDKRSVERIKGVVAWCQSDEFWRSNILSMAAVRRQFDALEIKMAEPGKNSTGPGGKQGTKTFSEVYEGMKNKTKNEGGFLEN